ncbi:DUF4326 domain-containing protein [Nonomuraea wenchangensis]|uniref:DUF4326 domain-containing protein n=1 Tax=Nonomuraea wenchangensis TaxID=568860 RepID=UPI0033256965
MAETRAPQRLQRRRAKGFRLPEGAACVDRTSRYGNMFAVRWDSSRSLLEWHVLDLGGRLSSDRLLSERYGTRLLATMAAVHLYDRHTRPEGVYALDPDRVRRDLAGKDLACFCPLPEPGQIDWCHAAHTLIPLANGERRA